jgi:hypothetical protein
LCSGAGTRTHLKRPFATVLADVRAENAAGGECLRTERTLVRPFAAVHAQMLNARTCTCCQHMHAKPCSNYSTVKIALCTRCTRAAGVSRARGVRECGDDRVSRTNCIRKYSGCARVHLPRTQRTRILAVTVVHTAGVLQVFVAIVWIGEHLATPMTPVTITV